MPEINADKPITRHQIAQDCRFCGEHTTEYKDPVTKDWWHTACHKKIHVITMADVVKQLEQNKKNRWG